MEPRLFFLCTLVLALAGCGANPSDDAAAAEVGGAGLDAASPDDTSRNDAAGGRMETAASDIGNDTSGGALDGGDARFSFFYTSLEGIQRLSRSPQGFGGDLRFGESTGLAGADKICQTLATDVGFGHKTWRAFLSVVQGPDGQPVHAIDRVGAGPWYDRNARLIAMDKAGLTSDLRPVGNQQATWDLADETGQSTSRLGDSHDVITASNTQGRLNSTDPASTCQDWTSVTATGQIMCGHAYPLGRSGVHWIAAHPAWSCVPGVNLIQGDGAPDFMSSIGAGGGWGGFYCFALQP